MSSTAITDIVTIAAALIGLAGSIIGATAAKRKDESRPAPDPPAPELGHGAPPYQPAQYARKVSRSVWWGAAGLLLWIIPILGYCVIIPGFFVGIRDFAPSRYRKNAALGITFCVIGFTLALINSAIGAYQGAHGQLWFQHG